MDYLWTLYLYGLKFYVVNSSMNFLLLYEISVIVWILYEFSVIFCIFSIFFALKLVIFGAPPLAAENRDFIFGIFNFWRLTVWPPKIKPYFRPVFFGGQKPPKISLLPPKIAYFRRELAYFRRLLAAENACSSCSLSQWRIWLWYQLRVPRGE